MKNILDIHSREEFRNWLMEHSCKEKECWLVTKRKKPNGHDFTYIDAVEEALCFGWIDSVVKPIEDVPMQRFSPRKKNSYWSELNKERVRRLIKLGLMTKEGKKVLPSLGPRSYKLDEDVEKALKKARVYKIFKSFPHLYQRVRGYNVSFYKKVDKKMYEAALKHLIEETKKNHMFGEWNDYGRLLDY